MLEDTTETPTDTTASAPWLIRAGLINITDVDYSMEMMPVIDSLACHIDRASLNMATVDMRSKKIFGRSLHIDSVAATYIYPAVTSTATTEAADTTVTPDSEMWTITADTLRLTGRQALYAQRGVTPAPGFDPSYIAASDIVIEIDSFYNRGTSIRVPLRTFTATERCGLPLRADGLFTMDGKSMNAEAFNIATLRSMLRFDAMMGIGDLTNDPSLPLSLKGNGTIAPADIALAFPDMKAMLAPLGLLSFSTDIDGTADELNVYNLDM